MSFDYKQLTPEHIKAARSFLKWDQADLARESELSRSSIQNAEKNSEGVADRTKRDIYRAFVDAGIEFFNGNAPGVRLHTEKQKDE